MTRCPKCGELFPDPGRSKGGKISKRSLTPAQQARLQAARAAARKRRQAARKGPP